MKLSLPPKLIDGFLSFIPCWMLMYFFAGFFLFYLTLCMTKVRILVLCFCYFTVAFGHGHPLVLL
jgi:hypothetical protein